MNQAEIEAFVTGLQDVQREENEAAGYTFFFVGDDHRLPFVTIAYRDNEYDAVSDLNRDGVFRLNIGVSRETFDSVLDAPGAQEAEYTQQNVFLPHPHYAPQNWVCILNPAGSNVEKSTQLMAEAHAIAARRAQRKQKDA